MKSFRDNNFDVLRLIAAGCVLLSHSFALINQREPLEVLSNGHYESGKLGVTIFFCISGYLITNSWLMSESPTRFVSSRILRIYPALVMAVIYSMAVAWVSSNSAFMDFFFNDGARHYFMQNTLMIWDNAETVLPNAFTTNPVSGGPNGSLWTLPLEIKCYLAVLLLGVVGLMRLRFVGLILAIIALVVYAETAFTIGTPIYKFSEFDLYTCFIAGALFRNINKANTGYLVLFIIGLIGFVLSQLGFASAHSPAYITVQIAICIGVLIVALSLPRRFNFPLPVDLSYGLYIYGFPTQQLLIHLMPAIHPINLCLLTLSIVIPLSWASWTWVEKPCLNLKSKIGRGLGLLPAHLAPSVGK